MSQFKTYSRKCKYTAKVINVPIRRSQRKKIEIKELPFSTENNFLDNSLQVELDNTFDKLVKADAFNHVAYKNEVKNISSDYESIHNSISNIKVQTFLHSPVIRNVNKRKRNKGKLVLPKKYDRKETTLDKSINESLFIEIEKSRVVEGISKSINEYSQKVENTKNDGISINTESLKLTESVDTDTSVKFLENTSKYSKVICSTPLIHCNKPLTSWISPIVTNNKKSETSLKPQVLLQKFTQHSESLFVETEKSRVIKDIPKSINEYSQKGENTKNDEILFDTECLKLIESIDTDTSVQFLENTSKYSKVICSTPLIHCNKPLKTNDEESETSLKPRVLLQNFNQHSENIKSVDNTKKSSNFSDNQKSSNKLIDYVNTASNDLFEDLDLKMISEMNGSILNLEFNSTSLLDKQSGMEISAPYININVSEVKPTDNANISNLEHNYDTNNAADIPFLGFPSIDQQSKLINLSNVALNEFTKDEILFEDSCTSKLPTIEKSINKSFTQYITLRRRIMTVDKDTNKSKMKSINLDFSNASFNIRLAQKKQNYSSTKSTSKLDSFNYSNNISHNSHTEVSAAITYNNIVSSQTDHKQKICKDDEQIKITDICICKPNQICLLPNIVEIDDSNGNISFNLDIPPKLQFVSPNAAVLKAGKWRRSLCALKRNSLMSSIWNKENMKHSPVLNEKKKTSVMFISNLDDHNCNTSVIKSYAASSLTENEKLRTCFEKFSLNSKNNFEKTKVITARDIVLSRCQQTEPIPFSECYSDKLLSICHKIGEGVYGEVFLFKKEDGSASVMKIIPIEGDKIVNEERQKKFEEIVSEIIIATELSNLRKNDFNFTSNFSEVIKVSCVQGKYPEKLLNLWNLYDEQKGSENDSPEMFEDDQLYIILELANGGQDLESFIFNNASQALSVFKQLVYTLAIAEKVLQFEHRDLHWGNVLLAKVDNRKMVTYKLDGIDVCLDSNGVEVAIIDFTLSRITVDDVSIYNDLSQDADLFTATHVDYQFQIYKLMQKHNSNEWMHFKPFTNILWLHYILDKMIRELRYKNNTTKIHKKYIKMLKDLYKTILNYNSVQEFAEDTYFLSI